jgi:uncharacterized membrane protein YbhN (UPF0104 family)
MRQIIIFATKVAISALLIYLAFRSVDVTILAERLNDLKAAWILAAVGLALVQLFLLSVRWCQIARACNAPLSLVRAFRIGLIAVSFNQALPSGGDVMRVWMFARAGAGWSKAAYSVLLDRFIGVLALAIVVVACLPWTLTLIHNPAGRAAVLFIGVGGIAGAVVFVMLGYVRWGWLLKWPVTRHVTHMASIVRTFLLSARRSVPVMALSLTVHAITATIAWCLAHAVDAPFGFFDALRLVPPVMLVAAVPISIAGWGVRERSLVWAFAMAGLPEADGFLVSVLLGTTMLILGCLGGVVWLSSAERGERNDTVAERA